MVKVADFLSLVEVLHLPRGQGLMSGTHMTDAALAYVEGEVFDRTSERVPAAAAREGADH